MGVGAWALTGILLCVIAALLVKIRLMQKSAAEILDGIAAGLADDTNTLIGISSRDRHMRALAVGVNAQLRSLRAARRRFQQGDLELKNSVTNISHDLRTPLTAIIGYLDLLEQAEQSDAVRRYLAIIRDRTEMLTQLTEELFRYSVILADGQQLAQERVVLNHVLEESIAAFYAVLQEHGITPAIRIPAQHVICRLDRAALSRVFSNLLSNAVKYSGGDLDISLRETGEICFSNSAPGLSEVQVGRLFDRFYTVEAADRSTGLGLSIARVLTEQMGGSIAAAYADGRLCVTLTFPPVISENSQKER